MTQSPVRDVSLAAPSTVQEQIDLVRRTIAKGATDDELQMFLYQAKRTGLDPLSGQIHFVKRWDSAQEREVGRIQIGIDGFRLIASRTNRYRPDDEAPRFTFNEKTGTLVSAKVRVYIKQATDWYPVETEAFYEEYVQRRKDGTATAMWRRMPRMMLAKCAEALALRKAFPAELSGVYAAEEFGDTTEAHDGTPPTVPSKGGEAASAVGNDAGPRTVLPVERASVLTASAPPSSPAGSPVPPSDAEAAASVVPLAPVGEKDLLAIAKEKLGFPDPMIMAVARGLFKKPVRSLADLTLEERKHLSDELEGIALSQASEKATGHASARGKA